MTDDKDPKGAPAPTTEQALDALFKDVNRGDAPGLVVGVMHRGRLLYRKGFGLASVEQGAANTPTTRMRIGSTSKHFACLAALLLAEEDKLDIDASVRRYVPELPVLQGEPTLRQLMNHTGGHRCHLDTTFIGNGMAIQPRGTALAAEVRQGDVNFAPGDKMIYNNGGYHLLSICIERVSGMAFEQFLKTRIFEPTGMVDTEAVPSDFDIKPGKASLHVPVPGGGWRRGMFPSEEVRGEGSMVSTVDDMLRWLAHLRGPQRHLGSASAWQQMLTPARLNDGTCTDYALGLMVHDYRGTGVVHHGGTVFGGTCQMLTVPAHELDIVIITNGAPLSPGLVANKMIDLLLKDEALAAPAEAPLVSDYPAWPGTQYWSPRSGVVVGFGEVAIPDMKGQLGLCILGNPAVPLFRSAGGEGGRVGVPMQMVAMGPFSLALPKPLADAPAPEVLEVKEGAVTDRFERLPATPPKTADVAPALLGSYRSDDAEARATLALNGNGDLEVRMTGHLGGVVYTAQPLSADVWRCQLGDPTLPLVAILNVVREAGAVTALRIDTGRSRRVLFQRQA